MTLRHATLALALFGLVSGAAVTHAQTTLEQQARAQAPQALVLYFASGSAAIRPSDTQLLDEAARLYRDGHPIIMVLTAGADAVGQPEANLRISQLRADAVLHGLVARGIPAERFQLLAKGESEPAVPTAPGVPEERNRRVEIRWHS